MSESCFKGGFGIQSAPDVKITLQKKGIERTNIIDKVVTLVTPINKTIKRIPDTRISRNLVVFEVGKEKTTLLILHAQNNGYTINTRWDGEVMVFAEDRNGEILLDNKNYKVYFLTKEDYRKIKENKKDNINPRGSITKEQKLLSLSGKMFEQYFMGGSGNEDTL